MSNKNKYQIVEKYTISNLTNVGMVRQSNQDYYGRYQGAYGELVIVCDGVGGYQGGEDASRIAVQSIAAHFEPLGPNIDVKKELANALALAQQNIAEFAESNPGQEDMATTAVVLVLRDARYWFAWIGDSRIYLRRGSATHPITKDHSWVQGLIDHNLISAEDAKNHPKKHVIVRSLGKEFQPADVRGPFPVNLGDVFLLCTDGLSDYFSDDELHQFLAKDPQQSCQELVAEANKRGGKDNITLQVVKSNIGSPLPRQSLPGKFNLLQIGLIAAAALVLVLLGAVALRHYQVWPFNPAEDTLKVVTPAPKPDSLQSDNEKDNPDQAEEDDMETKENKEPTVKIEVNIPGMPKKPAETKPKPTTSKPKPSGTTGTPSQGSSNNDAAPATPPADPPPATTQTPVDPPANTQEQTR